MTPPNLQRPIFVRASLLLLVIGAIWGELVFKLHTDWNTNPQYGFGDFVPFFIVFLLVLRWRDRPAPVAPPHAALLCAGAAGLLLTLLPLRIVQEANPDWRLLNWIHAFIVVALTHLALWACGGRRFSAHFAAPLILIFLAIPWPLILEQSAIQGLSRAVASGTTYVLNLAGIETFRSGTVLHVPTGEVSVEDACSGIRSLAGTLMSAVFIGEFYRLAGRHRLLLLSGGIVVALGLNFVRALFLSWMVALHGVKAIGRWHDSAGLLIFGISFAILWFGGDRLPGIPPTRSAEPIPLPLWMRIRPGILIGAGLWLLLVEIATERWFRNSAQPVAAAWNPVWPKEGEAFQQIPIPGEARATLRFNQGISALFKPDGSALWSIFYFQWLPGRASAQLAASHRPEICLPAAGLEWMAEEKPVTIQIDQTAMAFQALVFRHEGGVLHLFRSLSEEQAWPGEPRAFYPALADRIRSAWLGRRNLGQRILQIGISGSRTAESAREELRRHLPALVHATKIPSS
ncbi:MAG: exosortase/archaeosortase family protein [Verrucomicrobiota bacterium]